MARDLISRTRVLRLFNEPAVLDAPRRVWRDWALVAVFSTGVVLEGVLRHDVPMPVGVVAMCALLQLTLLWRRQYPLVALAIALGAINGYDVLARVVGWPMVEIYSAASLLLLVYALFRWGSGRHTLIGVVIMVAAHVVALVNDSSGPSDVIGGAIVLAVPALLGGEVRYLKVARAQQLSQAKSNEREQLARELHDSVAHHVSAIAIQAQAGLFLARSESLEGAVSALEVIEEQASRTLEEMRAMVEVLRHGDQPVDLAPQRGVAHIHELAALAGSEGPAIAVEMNGDLARLSPAVDAALYRVAQESLTNAVRHARNAKRIEVCVRGTPDHVELTVTDDGTGSISSASPGYGIVGMQERALLLGGSLEAAPGSTGWMVTARFPRQRVAT